MVEFSIYGESFEPEHITRELGIMPSETYWKGDIINHGKNTRKETAWIISTGYEISNDINDQIEKILALLDDKIEILIKLKTKFSLNILFMIVIMIENKETPAMYFKKHFIQFVSKIGAEIGFDTYVC
jgi:hypothetical protein